MRNTSWQKVAGWYNNLVREKGHYYHEHLIIPKSLHLLGLDNSGSILDLACGQGILARHIPQNIYYQGIDSSASLVNFAKKQDMNSLHNYAIGDITKPLPIDKKDFTHAAIILALQNIDNPKAVFEKAAEHLENLGKLLIVVNHPCFRIPRQSGWGIDQGSKLQYRRVNRYMEPFKIPVNIHPGQSQSSVTWSFHFPISSYSQYLHETGFVVVKIEEWISDKKSTGQAAKMENFGRSEFPLFMAILARKEKGNSP